MTESEINDNYRDIVEEICWPDTNARDWVFQVFDVVSVWDDIVDGDPVDKEKANLAMMAMFTQWGLNTFYVKYIQSLNPIMILAVDHWKWSNRGSSPKNGAFQIYTDIPLAVAYILGGQERVDSFSERLRESVNAMMIEDDIRDGGAK